MADSASSRYTAPPLRCGPSDDPPPSTQRSAAMAASKLPATGRSLDAVSLFWAGVSSRGFSPAFLPGRAVGCAVCAPMDRDLGRGRSHIPGLGDATMWHVHEMMFGYVGAALGGFMLTAVPNWTGRPPVRGWPLGALALIWLCGRSAVWWGGTVGPMPTAVADLAYLGVLSVLVGNAIVAGRNWRNLPGPRRAYTNVDRQRAVPSLRGGRGSCGRGGCSALHRRHVAVNNVDRRAHRSELHAQLVRAASGPLISQRRWAGSTKRRSP